MTITTDVVPDGKALGQAGRARVRRWRGWLRATHVWFGLLSAVGVIVVSATGIVLNHTSALGWGSKGPPAVQGSGGLADAAPINDLLRAALREGVSHGVQTRNELGRFRPASGPSGIDRALFRPGTATVQVRLGDLRHTEFTLDWSTGAVLDVGERRDVRLGHLHSGEAFGQRGVVASDMVAVVVVGLALGGAALWGKRLAQRRPGRGRRAGRWLAVNWWFHLVGGLAVIVYTVVLSVTGVILNHKREWGFMVEPVQYIADEDVARSEPASLDTIVGWAVEARTGTGAAVTIDDVRFVDYRPLAALAKVRFTDEHEVVVDVYEPRVLSSSQRRDVWIEDLHSGVRFGSHGSWLSDITAGILILLTVNGLYLWARPAVSGRSRPEATG